MPQHERRAAHGAARAGEEAGLDVRASSVAALEDEKSAPWTNGIAIAKSRYVSPGKPGSRSAGERPFAITARKTSGKKREEEAPRLVEDPDHGAPRELGDVREPEAHAGTRLPAPSSSPSPSSVRPVFARKTSSSVGACSRSCATSIPAASSAR